MQPNPSPWLAWARELYSMAQAGLTYCQNDFDLDRYRRLQEISAEIIASQSALEKAAVLESFSMQAGYATPKVDVRGAVMRAGKILLVQEKTDGRWSLPGGWADLNDSPAEVVAREVREESGFEVRVDKLIAVFDANRHIQPVEFYRAYKLIFLCSITGGAAEASFETPAVDFFEPGNLPPLSMLRTNQRILDEVFRHFADPNLSTAFD
ncbi:MAG: NUDIX domain-containing protein [Chloroflexi bacterium]|nr:MAG: NUDIX domain-containing protein [Chloroflexota bacterium]